MSENVFRINMNCGNCGAEFSKEFPAKTEIREEDSWPHNYVRKYLGEYIVCPACEEKGHLTITSRKPIVKQPNPLPAGFLFGDKRETETSNVPPPEDSRQRAGRELHNYWYLTAHPAQTKDDAEEDWKYSGRNLCQAWCDLAVEYIPRPAISDEELAEILIGEREAPFDLTRTWLRIARAARKALLGEETK